MIRRLFHRALAAFLSWDCASVRGHDVRRNRRRSFCVQCGWYYCWEE